MEKESRWNEGVKERVMGNVVKMVSYTEYI